MDCNMDQDVKAILEPFLRVSGDIKMFHIDFQFVQLFL